MAKYWRCAMSTAMLGRGVPTRAQLRGTGKSGARAPPPAFRRPFLLTHRKNVPRPGLLQDVAAKRTSAVPSGPTALSHTKGGASMLSTGWQTFLRLKHNLAWWCCPNLLKSVWNKKATCICQDGTDNVRGRTARGWGTLGIDLELDPEWFASHNLIMPRFPTSQSLTHRSLGVLVPAMCHARATRKSA